MSLKRFPHASELHKYLELFSSQKSKSMLTQARKPLGPVCPLLEMFETQVDDKTKHAIKISSLVQQSLSTNYHKLKI